jgi:hypothetical protein
MRRLAAILPTTLLLLAAPSCKKDKPSTKVSLSPDDESEPSGSGTTTEVIPPRDRGPIAKIELHGSASGIADMLAAGNQLIAAWAPPEPGSPAVDLRALLAMALIQQGFAPGFLDSLALDQVHAFEFAYPQEGQPGTSEADIELAVALSASDPVRVIESLPAGLRPQPLGNNLWQLAVEQLQVYMRANSDAVEIALAMDQLDRAAGLRAKVPAGARFRLGASDIPPGDIDLGELLPIGGSVLTDVLNETSAIELSGDFGSARDLSGRIDVTAPFDKLGLEPIGPATQGPSALAELLPDNAMLAWQMPWGNPRLLHGMIDRQIPVNQIPAPFDAHVADIMKGVHAILDQISKEVVAAAYLDAKQNFTLVLAFELKDEAAARTAWRNVMKTSEKALGEHIALVGNAPEHKYSVAFKEDAVKAGKAKADALTITLSKSLANDPELEVLDSLVGRKSPKLEVLGLASGNKMIVAIGAGSRGVMAEVGRKLDKPATDSLEDAGGLALARKLTDGCQYCVAIDPVELMRMVLMIGADDPDNDAAYRKVARDGVTALAKLDLEGQVALAGRFAAQQGVFGMLVPKTLLFVDPAKLTKVIGIFEALDDAEGKAEAKAVAPPR